MKLRHISGLESFQSQELFSASGWVSNTSRSFCTTKKYHFIEQSKRKHTVWCTDSWTKTLPHRNFQPQTSTISIPENIKKKSACLYSCFQSSLLSTVSFWSQMHSWGAEPPWANINREGRQGGTINTVWETEWDRQTATIPQCNAARQWRQLWYVNAVWHLKMGRFGYLNTFKRKAQNIKGFHFLEQFKMWS